MIDQLTKTDSADRFEVMLDKHGIDLMAHDDFNFFPVAWRREIREGGAQGSESAAIGAIPVFDLPPTRCPSSDAFDNFRFWPNAGPLHQSPPDLGKSADLIGEPRPAFVAAFLESDQWQSPGGHKKQMLESRLSGGSDICLEQFLDLWSHGNHSPYQSDLAPAVVDDVIFPVNDLFGEIGQIGVIQCARQSQSQPKTLGCIRLFPHQLNLTGREALGLCHSAITMMLLGRSLEERTVFGNLADDALLATPLEERFHISDSARESRRRIAGERLGELLEIGRSEVIDEPIRSDASPEFGEGVNIIGAREWREGLGLSGVDARIQVGVEPIGALPERKHGVFVDGLCFGANLFVDGLLLLGPMVLDFIGRDALATGKSHVAAIPADVTVSMNRESILQLFADSSRDFGTDFEIPLGKLGLDSGHTAHCGSALWAVHCCLISPRIFVNLTPNSQCLKIHVSPVRFRLYPFPFKQQQIRQNKAKTACFAAAHLCAPVERRRTNIYPTNLSIPCGAHCGEIFAQVEIGGGK